MKPNIVLITIDCWRGDHLSIVNPNHAHTPELDAIARNAHLFSNAHSCGGWTRIAMTSLFSSTFASMYGFTQGKYNPARPNLAVELQNHGYQTAGFTTNLVCGRLGGFDLGFEHFEDLRPPSKGRLQFNRHPKFERLATHPITGPIVANTLPFALPFYPTTDAKDLVNAGLKWVRQSRDKPYFLWLHFMDLHWPYRSSKRTIDRQEFSQMWQDRRSWRQVRAKQGRHYPGDERAERWKQLYAEETETLDTEIGRLIKGLKSTQDWNNTALCISSDHGEEFYEHGTWAHSWNQLYQEGTHIPLIIKPPNQTQGRVVSEATSQLDIAPTLLHIAGIEPKPTMLGQNLLTSLEDKPISCEMFGHSHSHIYRLSIRHNGYHYLYDGDNSQCFLYSIKEPENNIYQRDCPHSKRFDKLRLAHITKGALDMLKQKIIIGEDEVSYNLDDDPAVVERLRALGYMD